MKQLINLSTIFLGIIGGCSAILVCFILFIYPNLDSNATSKDSESPIKNTNIISEDASVVSGQIEFQSQIEETASEEPSLNDLLMSNETPVTSDDFSTSNSVSAETTGQKNALSSAKNYINIMNFSYQGLIEQLEFEKYSHEDAVYAADNCGADWNEQALRSAKNYLNLSAFSYKGLIEQLEFEKFTPEQATYGVDNCGADWNEQAKKSAKNYTDLMSFSRDGLIDQLEFEGYTHEQAVYGVESNGFQNDTSNNNNFNTYNNIAQQNTTDTYVLNTNSKKIHYPNCNDVTKIAPENYSTSNLSIGELEIQGYTTCGHCF